MNALEIIREACGVLSISRPNSVSGSSDKTVIQLLALLNQEGRELSARYEWQALTFEATFATVAAESQGTLTTIIGAARAFRSIVNETMWNRTTGLPVVGPNSALEWQLRKTLGLSGPLPEYRIRGDTLLFLPTPTAGESIYFEYVSKHWATNSTGETYKRLITSDEDLFLLDDEIMLAGIIWRWRKAKGLQYAEDFNSYEALVVDAMAKDGTARTLNLASSSVKQERLAAVPRQGWNL